MTINEKDAMKKFMLHAQIKKTGEFQEGDMANRPSEKRSKV